MICRSWSSPSRRHTIQIAESTFSNFRKGSLEGTGILETWNLFHFFGGSNYSTPFNIQQISICLSKAGLVLRQHGRVTYVTTITSIMINHFAVIKDQYNERELIRLAYGKQEIVTGWNANDWAWLTVQDGSQKPYVVYFNFAGKLTQLICSGRLAHVLPFYWRNPFSSAYLFEIGFSLDMAKLYRLGVQAPRSMYNK